MQPKFESDEAGPGSNLLCPHCGFNYLHHERVEVFERDEDATVGVHVLIVDGKATVDTVLNGNPSSRRNGLNIHFWCEGCKAKPVLSIAQHKGNTCVDFQ